MINNLTCKSALLFEQLMDKKQCGVTKLEIQLLNDFIEYDGDYTEYVEMIEKSDLEICAVHMPIVNSLDIELQCLNTLKSRTAFIKTCSLAQTLGEYFNKTVMVVIHMGWSMKKFNDFPQILHDVDKLLLKALSLFSNIEIVIENVFPFVKYPGDIPQAKDGYLFDTVDYVKYFTKKYQTNRIGTVLDICHAIITIRFLNILSEYGMSESHYVLEDYFRENKDTIKLIHLANVIDLGYTTDSHGCSFKHELDDMMVLKDILSLYSKYKYKCLVTIEVFEKDYTNSKNFRETYENIKSFY